MKEESLKIKIETIGIEEVIEKLQVLKNDLLELKKLGLKNKTINLLVKDLLEVQCDTSI